MRKKEFTIVAGANGVGKSTLKDRFIRPDTEYFNGDIVFAQLLEKYPHLEMVSFGPTLRGVHSPDERLEIPTVDKFWKLLVGVVDALR